MRIARRLHATLDRIDATLERNTQAFEDLQVAIRASATRHERALQSFERRLDANTAQVRALTDATWRMLDRWGEGPSATS